MNSGPSAARRSRQNVVVYDGLVKIALAEAEVAAGDLERALKILEEALATCDRMGYRAYECELHRARGELLLGAIPLIPPPRKPSRPPSPSPGGKARAASNCARVRTGQGREPGIILD